MFKYIDKNIIKYEGSRNRSFLAIRAESRSTAFSIKPLPDQLRLILFYILDVYPNTNDYISNKIILTTATL